jgi:Zn-dependent protease with chaperone function
MQHLVGDMRIGPDQGGELHAKFVLAARILDLPELPELYLTMDMNPNAHATGFSRPMVVLNHGLIEMLGEGELLAIIGHELGHVKCGHVLNNSLAALFASAGVRGVASLFPIVGNAALTGMLLALRYWSRMAEFSADRAALLVVQDREIVARALSKLAGFHGKFVPELNFQSLLRQIDDYEAYGKDALQALVKMQSEFAGLNYTHPYSVLRVKRILDWGDGDQFQDILSGTYARTPGQ